jgi:hypothetical protein
VTILCSSISPIEADTVRHWLLASAREMSRFHRQRGGRERGRRCRFRDTVTEALAHPSLGTPGLTGITSAALGRRNRRREH